MKIAILGAGNMGSALARGLSQSTLVQAEDITVSNPSTPKLDALRADIPGLNTTTSNAQAASQADLVFLAVKPAVVDDVLTHLPLHHGQVIASLVAGRDIRSLLTTLASPSPDNPPVTPTLFRIIPNTAAAIGQSMTLVSTHDATPQQQQLMLQLLAPLGPTALVPEDKLAAATALASCGTAYILKYIQSAIQAGIELGLNAHDSRRLTTQCVLGAAALLQADPRTHPAIEIEKVCTPGGYTIRGINQLDHAGFTSAIIQAIKASI